RHRERMQRLHHQRAQAGERERAVAVHAPHQALRPPEAQVDGVLGHGLLVCVRKRRHELRRGLIECHRSHLTESPAEAALDFHPPTARRVESGTQLRRFDMKVACVLAKDFEDSEFREPYDALRNAGHEVTLVGMKAQEELEGDKGRERTKTDTAFSDVKPDQFDALFIPGGYSPDKLRAQDAPVQFVKAFMQAGKPVLAICHGPQLLLTADEHRNHRMTAWKTVQGDLKKAGANVVD